MGGRIRWGKAGVAWPRAIDRTLPASAIGMPWNAKVGAIATTGLTHAQVHVFDLQQSGVAGCLVFAGAVDSSGACSPWWQGIVDSAIASACALADAAAASACACICIICTDAMAEAAPLNTRATHSRRRNKMKRADMARTVPPRESIVHLWSRFRVWPQRCIHPHRNCATKATA